ncbi:Vacuolar protein sorting-associated protein 17 [Hypsizygus marmoreus]|uniref:Vacuolar protein sorting-associated protein 17 n=1 Tax=Hypsizygus marmoreus TaxID=39966 RepID=A0A369JMX0_HYPMA|nr:Vacuolar protein sorting-associated protein 17 [Hypsizygus marmoreus]
MFDPLNSTASIFAGTDDVPPWPTTPHSNEPIPNLRRASTPVLQTPDKGPAPGIYGKEPQIYGQPDTGLISPRETVGSNGTKYEKPEPYLRVRITGLDRNRRDILVKLDAQTNLSNFTGTTYRNVSRSYLEFQQFYESIIHSNPQTIIPALPLAQTSAPTDEEDDRLVKIMLQRWITRVCEDPILLHDEDLRSFIENDFGYQPTPQPRRKTSSGFSLLKRGVPDEDEELQRARFELTKLEGQFFDTARAVDKLALARKSLAAAHVEMGNKLINVATTEAHPPLGNAFRKIGGTWHSLADLGHAQAISECVVVGDSLGYQGMNARSAKETLLMRTGVLEEYQTAVKTTISKRRQIERLKASSNIRPDRVDEALEEMEEANKYEQMLAKRAEGISQNLHQALKTHNRYANDDITTALIEHARSSIMYERQLLRELEALRGDVSNAAKKVVPAINGVPKPTVIPPLEEYNDNHVPPPRPPPTGPMANDFQQNRAQLPNPPHTSRNPGPTPQRPPIQSYPSQGPPAQSTFPQGPLSSPAGPLGQRQEPLSASSTQPQRGSFSPAPSHSSFRSTIPPQSPGAGPSSSSYSQITFAKPPLDEPPLGGRFVDGTKSMFIKPTQAPHAPPPLGSPSSTFNQHPQRTESPLQYDPLSRPAAPAAYNAPSRPLNGMNGQIPQGNGFDPLGHIKPHQMSSSVRVQPTRPRLDPREAASKLANMF